MDKRASGLSKMAAVEDPSFAMKHPLLTDVIGGSALTSMRYADRNMPADVQEEREKKRARNVVPRNLAAGALGAGLAAGGTALLTRGKASPTALALAAMAGGGLGVAGQNIGAGLGNWMGTFKNRSNVGLVPMGITGAGPVVSTLFDSNLHKDGVKMTPEESNRTKKSTLLKALLVNLGIPMGATVATSVWAAHQLNKMQKHAAVTEQQLLTDAGHLGSVVGAGGGAALAMLLQKLSNRNTPSQYMAGGVLGALAGAYGGHIAGTALAKKKIPQWREEDQTAYTRGMKIRADATDEILMRARLARKSKDPVMAAAHITEGKVVQEQAENTLRADPYTRLRLLSDTPTPQMVDYVRSTGVATNHPNILARALEYLGAKR